MKKLLQSLIWFLYVKSLYLLILLQFGTPQWSSTTSSPSSTTTTKTHQYSSSASSPTLTRSSGMTIRRSSSSPRDCLPSHRHVDSGPHESSSHDISFSQACPQSSIHSSASSTITCINCSYTSNDDLSHTLNPIRRDVSFHSSEDSGYSQEDCLQRVSGQTYKDFPK